MKMIQNIKFRFKILIKILFDVIESLMIFIISLFINIWFLFCILFLPFKLWFMPKNLKDIETYYNEKTKTWYRK